MEKLQYDSKEYKLYLPDSLKYLDYREETLRRNDLYEDYYAKKYVKTSRDRGRK